MRRRWIRAVVALALVTALAVGWAMFAGNRSNRTPDGEVAPGEVWQSADGTQVRVQGWRSATDLPGFDGKPVDHVAGASWVVVTLRFTNRNPQALCEPQLFGPDDQRWRVHPGPPETTNPHYCDRTSSESLVDVVYEVPTSRVDGLRGVSFGVFKRRQPALLLLPDPE